MNSLVHSDACSVSIPGQTEAGPVVGFRARKNPLGPSWYVERELSCINGLSAWFVLCTVSEPDEQEVGYSDGACGTAQENAERVSKALNATTAAQAGRGGDEGEAEVHKPPPIVPGVREAVERIAQRVAEIDLQDGSTPARAATFVMADIRTLLNAFRGSGHE